MSGSARRGLVGVVWAHRDVRTLLLAIAASQTAAWLFGVALVVYAFQETRSAAWVAAATILRTLPGVLFGTVAGALADRYERRRVLAASHLLSGACLAALAAGAAARATPLLVVLGLAFVAATAKTPAGPAEAAMVPALVPEDDLSATNAATSAVEHAALLAGPVIGGVLLALAPASVAFGVCAALYGFAALGAARVGRAEVGTEPPGGGLRTRIVEGCRALVTQREVAVLAVFLMLSMFVYGIELVLLVLVAEELIGTGSEGVGFLMGAAGFGGLLAAGAVGRLAGARYAGAVLAAAALLLGVPLALLAFVRTPTVAYGLMVLEGAGSIALDVLVLTMLQRLLDRRVLARVFGLLESGAVASLMLGSLVAPALVVLAGLRPALVVTGALMPLLAVAAYRCLVVLGGRSRKRQLALAPRVDVLRRVGVFEGAPLPALEALAEAIAVERHPAGTVLIVEGAPPDDFYVVRQGSLEVLTGGDVGRPAERVNVLGPGDHFGEIGLLRRIPRTATVRTLEDCELYRISGEDFLAAVSELPSRRALLTGVTARLARTHPTLAAQEDPDDLGTGPSTP